MFDLLIHNTTLPDVRTGMKVMKQDGRITDVAPGLAIIRQCIDAVTTRPARILHLDGYGIAPSCHANFVLLHAQDAVGAIRLRATRLKVHRRGKLLVQTSVPVAELRVDGRPGMVGGLQGR